MKRAGTSNLTRSNRDMQEEALPVLRSILAEPDNGESVLIEGALDLAAALLHSAPPQEAIRTHAALSQPVMNLLLTHDDAAVLQSCCEYLRYSCTHWVGNGSTTLMPRSQFAGLSAAEDASYYRVLIKRGGAAVLCYGGADPEATMREIVTALKRLLQPDAGDSAPLFVGQVRNFSRAQNVGLVRPGRRMKALGLAYTLTPLLQV